MKLKCSNVIPDCADRDKKKQQKKLDNQTSGVFAPSNPCGLLPYVTADDKSNITCLLSDNVRTTAV